MAKIYTNKSWDDLETEPDRRVETRGTKLWSDCSGDGASWWSGDRCSLYSPYRRPRRSAYAGSSHHSGSQPQLHARPGGVAENSGSIDSHHGFWRQRQRLDHAAWPRWHRVIVRLAGAAPDCRPRLRLDGARFLGVTETPRFGLKILLQIFSRDGRPLRQRNAMLTPWCGQKPVQILQQLALAPRRSPWYLTS